MAKFHVYLFLWRWLNFIIFAKFYVCLFYEVCKTSWFLAIFMKLVIGKKIRVSSIFDSRWRNEASNFHLRKFGKVEPFWEHCGPDVDINTKNSLDNSGSNETAKGSSFDSLALTDFSKKLWGSKILKIWTCVFHPIWIQFDMGNNLGQRTT